MASASFSLRFLLHLVPGIVGAGTGACKACGGSPSLRKYSWRRVLEESLCMVGCTEEEIHIRVLRSEPALGALSAKTPKSCELLDSKGLFLKQALPMSREGCPTSERGPWSGEPGISGLDKLGKK